MAHMCSALGDLSCYITRQGERARDHGASEPDHTIVANLLFPHISYGYISFEYMAGKS